MTKFATVTAILMAATAPAMAAPTAAEIFAALYAEDDSNNNGTKFELAKGTPFSTKGVNTTADKIHAQLAAE